eukprot:133384_1
MSLRNGTLLQKLGLKRLFKSHKEFKKEWFLTVYCGFLPEDQIVSYIGDQSIYLIRSLPKRCHKTTALREFIMYLQCNYTNDDALFDRKIWNLFTRMDDLNFTNNLAEIINLYWKKRIGTRASIHKAVDGVAQLDARATIDFETLKKHWNTDKYTECFNKKPQKTIDRDRKIQEIMREYNTKNLGEYNFKTAKQYLMDITDCMKPYLKDIESTIICDVSPESVAPIPQPIPDQKMHAIRATYTFRNIEDNMSVALAQEYLGSINNTDVMDQLLQRIATTQQYKSLIEEYCSANKASIGDGAKFNKGDALKHHPSVLPEMCFIGYKVGRWWYPALTLLVEPQNMILLFFNDKNQNYERMVVYDKLANIKDHIRVL